jgi:hypothetical protein
VKKFRDFQTTANAAYPDSFANVALTDGKHLNTIGESGVAVELVVESHEGIGIEACRPALK